MVHVIPPPVFTVVGEFELELLDIFICNRISLDDDAVDRMNFSEVDLKPLSVIFLVGRFLNNELEVDKNIDKVVRFLSFVI